MKLYIANCSKNEHLFTYMLPEVPRPFSHSIRAGGQIEIPGGQDAIDAIIKQHEIYGMQPVDKVGKGFGGLCYRLDKPISVEAIKSGFTQTEQEMVERSLEARKITAAAQDQIFSRTAQETGMQVKSGIEFEVVEEKKNQADNEPKFQQTIEVVHEGIAPRRGRPRKSA
jgi:hypothetical protein